MKGAARRRKPVQLEPVHALRERAEGFQRALTLELHRQDWAIHELRDMGSLSRELIETGERVHRLELALEPRARSVILGDGVRGGDAGALERAMLRRTLIAERRDQAYAFAARKLDPRQMTALRFVLSYYRPSVGMTKQAFGLSFRDVVRLVENGLIKIHAAEQLNPKVTAINDLLRN